MPKTLPPERLNQAKRRLFDKICDVGLTFDEKGEFSTPENFDDAAVKNGFLKCKTLSAAFARLTHAQQMVLRRHVEHPAFDYVIDLKNHISWCGDERVVLDMLEAGKSIELAAASKIPSGPATRDRGRRYRR